RMAAGKDIREGKCKVARGIDLTVGRGNAKDVRALEVAVVRVDGNIGDVAGAAVVVNHPGDGRIGGGAAEGERAAETRIAQMNARQAGRLRVDEVGHHLDVVQADEQLAQGVDLGDAQAQRL